MPILASGPASPCEKRYCVLVMNRTLQLGNCSLEMAGQRLPKRNRELAEDQLALVVPTHKKSKIPRSVGRPDADEHPIITGHGFEQRARRSDDLKKIVEVQAAFLEVEPIVFPPVVQSKEFNIRLLILKERCNFAEITGNGNDWIISRPVEHSSAWWQKRPQDWRIGMVHAVIIS